MKIVAVIGVLIALELSEGKAIKECEEMLRASKTGNKNYLDFTQVNRCYGHEEGFLEDDIKLTKEQAAVVKEEIEKEKRREKEQKNVKVHSRKKRGVSSVVTLWKNQPDGTGQYIVPYTISSEQKTEQRTKIENALAEMSKYTCLKFTERTNQKDYLEYQKDGGCWSFVGKKGGKQVVSIDVGCDTPGTIVHETMHALGFWHEQSRPDRDQFLRILFQNIDTNMLDNFNKYSTSKVNSLGSPYDVNSVMQYGGYSFTKNDQPTIMDRKTQQPVVRQAEWSSEDVKQLNKLYGCPVYVAGNCKKSSLPRVTNGVLQELKEVYEVQDRVFLKCNDGYKIKGDENSVCKDGAFTPTELTCVEDSCTDDKNSCAYWAGNRYCTNEYANYMKINCRKSCGLCGGCSTRPTIQGDGWITNYQDHYNNKTTIEYQCALGHKPVGPQTSTCTDKKWSVEKFTCVSADNPTCPSTTLPRVTGFGRMAPLKDKYAEGEKVLVSCGDGYKPKETDVEATCKDGQFTPKHFTCIQIPYCAKAPVVQGQGTVSPVKDRYLEDEKVSLTCSNQYASHGETVATCKNGMFNPNVFHCFSTATICTKQSLPSVEGGAISEIKAEYKYGEEVHVTCQNGFKPLGETKATCINTKFDVEKLQCYNPICPAENLPKVFGSGTLQPKKASYAENEEVKLVCASGFLSRYDSKTTCVKGQFVKAEFQCHQPAKKITCLKTTLPWVRGEGSLEPLKDEYIEKERVELKCKKGYKPKTASFSTCGANGQFDQLSLECVRGGSSASSLECNTFLLFFSFSYFFLIYQRHV